MGTYCAFASEHPVHAYYHDNEYGFPVKDENIFLERFALEIFQAGLSWEIVLRKRAATFEAFRKFHVATVATFNDRDVERLLGNAGIIRNRLKINAIIHNAGIISEMSSGGGFKGWLDAHHPMNRDAWTRLFKKTFKFTGGEIVNELLMSTGYLPGTHEPSCPVYGRIKNLNPPWMQADSSIFETG